MTRMIAPALAFALALSAPAQAEPPFQGTAFIAPGLIDDASPGTALALIDAGQAPRQMFDRRANAFVTVNAWLFRLPFSDAPEVEVQVNPEFGGQAEARAAAAFYVAPIGALPRALREDLRTVWIHAGDNDFGGGNENLLIHTGRTPLYVDLDSLHEVFVHEAAHTSLDDDHAAAPGWLAARQADGEFISTYARDNPATEDVAESFLAWLALTCRPESLASEQRTAIMAAIPARLAYFDAQGFDLSPMACTDPDLILRDGFEGP